MRCVPKCTNESCNTSCEKFINLVDSEPPDFNVSYSSRRGEVFIYKAVGENEQLFSLMEDDLPDPILKALTENDPGAMLRLKAWIWQGYQRDIEDMMQNS